jgi:hypothetical protein
MKKTFEMKAYILFSTFLILYVASSDAQSRIILDTLTEMNLNGSGVLEEGLWLTNNSHVLNPLTNRFQLNAARYGCFEKNSESSSCLLQLMNYSEGIPHGVYNFYWGDSTLIMSGTMEHGKLHGLFRLYCDEPRFPYCEKPYDYPVREIIYYRDKLVSDMKLDPVSGKIIQLKSKNRKLRW